MWSVPPRPLVFYVTVIVGGVILQDWEIFMREHLAEGSESLTAMTHFLSPLCFFISPGMSEGESLSPPCCLHHGGLNPQAMSQTKLSSLMLLLAKYLVTETRKVTSQYGIA